MTTAVALLIFCWLVANTTESCPDNFNCYTQRDTFVLRCKPFLDHLQFRLVNGAVDEVPAGATHVKITCFDRRIPVNLKFAYLPNIRKLTLHHLSITTLNEQMFRGITNISYLVMTKLFCKRFEKYSFNGLTNLRSLKIEYLDELEYMHPDMLKPLEALKSLSFRYIGSKRDALNYEDYSRVLGGINSTGFDTLVLYAIHSVHHQETQLNITDLFRHGSVGVSLKHLDLGRNNIGYFRGSPAIELPVLEYISLGENVIVGSHLHTMRNLQNLDLSDNKLTTLSANTRTELDEMATVQVDISGNPLHCLCNNTDFVTWIHTSKVKFLNNRPRTLSVSPDVELDHVVYERDAFICYNSNDREWVLTELLTRLEKNNISSIIHDIDFLPGASVINIIGESMERSRFTVLVLSPDFLSSNWCLFELDSARTHAISRGRDVIVPIILREFSTAPNSRHLADIFDKSYLKWTNDKEGQSVFWDKLITKLKHGGNITRMKN
ncbi:hypothetical protein LSAT2_004104 [Lamellibrachia satsuma]|nr:hypothetical protein LSAT2_004104 [Lamellibrachia satsuma]